MRRSFLRLVIRSVLICWVLGFVALTIYSRSLSWTEDRARSDGVFLAHELLEAEAPDDRTQRLQELRVHFPFELTLVPAEEVERRLGHSVSPGDRIPWRESPRVEWYFLAFADGEPVLAAGPVNPARPAGYQPIGIIVALVTIPLLAALLAVRVEREVAKVERASEELATGELSARVHNPDGPSNELASKFNAMAARIERLIRSRDELVQAVSHELGSPLSRLRFHIELLQNEPVAQQDERLHTMTRELDALDELVAELLSFVQADELPVDAHTFDPTDGLLDLAELARLEQPVERSIDVDVTVAGDCSVFADPRLFQRAVENLLRNAVRYAQNAVNVEVKRDGEGLSVAVHDDGPGIPPEHRERVMKPFFRMQSDRGRQTGGVGLGLAIVHRIVERHRGSVSIKTSPLGGAAVITRWPNRDEAAGRAVE